MEEHRSRIMINEGGRLPQIFGIYLNTNHANATTNGHLTVEKRLHFIRNDFGNTRRTDEDGNIYEFEEFTEVEFENFKNEFRRLNEEYWSNKFVIVTPSSFDRFNVVVNVGGTNHTIRPNLKCDLRIVFVNSRTEADSTFQICNQWRIVNGERVQISSFAPTQGRWDSDSRSFVGGQDGQLLTYANSPTQNRVWEQTPSIHEFGHSIGEEHVGIHDENPACITGPGFNVDALACYEDSIGDTGNILGEGMMVDNWNAEPWLFGLERILGGQIRRWTLEVNRLGDARYSFSMPVDLGDAPFYQQENFGLF